MIDLLSFNVGVEVSVLGDIISTESERPLCELEILNDGDKPIRVRHAFQLGSQNSN